MLAARDQENLVHGHQAAAASKPLNQGTKQLPPKTPGRAQLAPKTPFKVPLNDENGGFGQGGLRTILKTNGKGNENLSVRGKKTGGQEKNAFITPSGPRAPLGAKTANAKAKAFQTPAPAPKDNAPKDSKDSASAPTKSTARKPKPRVSHAEMTKVEVFSGDNDLLEREIEYMPPPAKDLPNEPDDLPELNLSMFEDGNFTRGCLHHYYHEPDASGLSYAQRHLKAEKEYLAKVEQRQDAILLKELESTRWPCFHEPACPADHCKSNAEARKAAEAKCRKTLAELNLYPEDREEPPKPKKERPTSKGPSLATAKRAANSLSQQPKLPAPSTAKAPLPKASTAKPKAPAASSFLKSKKKTPPPTNPSSMRATASAAASRQTIGYAKGRSTSATLRTAFKDVPSRKPAAVPSVTGRTLMTRDPPSPVPAETEVEDPMDLAPAEFVARYGLPNVGTEMWFRCRDVGYFAEPKEDEDREEGSDVGEVVVDWIREEAERDFELVLGGMDGDEVGAEEGKGV